MPLENQQNPDPPASGDLPADPASPTAHSGDDAVAPFPSEPAAVKPEVATPARRRRDWEKVRATRTGRAWTGLIVGAIILVLLLVFIIQNLDSARLKLFAWEWNLPIGVAVLFAVIIGALLAGLIGGARILQLRRAAKKP